MHIPRFLAHVTVEQLERAIRAKRVELAVQPLERQKQAIERHVLRLERRIARLVGRDGHAAEARRGYRLSPTGRRAIARALARRWRRYHRALKKTELLR